ncbi:MAG: DUF2378 family protein [Polyangiales bacterium]
MNDMSIDASWGERDVSTLEAQAFAREFGPDRNSQSGITTTLERFPHACQVRGMFFDGLANVVRKKLGAIETNELMDRVGVPRRCVGFALYPHRDFYKLYFAAAPRLHPSVSFADALGRIAETFYPVFRESMLGRTMAPLMGREPAKILSRLAQAYSISIPWNEHKLTPGGDSAATWECRVEPSTFYPNTLRGIVRGTLASHDVDDARVEVVSVQELSDQSRYTFEITW